MNKIKLFFRIEMDAPEKIDDISKIREKKFFVIYLSFNSIPLPFQKLWHFLYEGGWFITPYPHPPPFPPSQVGLMG